MRYEVTLDVIPGFPHRCNALSDLALLSVAPKPQTALSPNPVQVRSK